MEYVPYGCLCARFMPLTFESIIQISDTSARSVVSVYERLRLGSKPFIFGFDFIAFSDTFGSEMQLNVSEASKRSVCVPY